MRYRTVAIVQARMGSTRLPGKVLMDLRGETVLAHVVRRLQAVPGADAVCVAVPDKAEDDPVAEEARRLGALVSRGPEADVLERYRKAAEQCDAGMVMRVTSDCPFLDPEVCGALLRLLAESGADYACNNMPRGWAHGLDAEAFFRDRLELAAAKADRPEQREHVTPWLRTTPGLRRVNLAGPGNGLEYRLTLDFPADMAMFRRLHDHLPPPPAIPSYADILAVLDHHPEIATLNHRHHTASTG